MARYTAAQNKASQRYQKEHLDRIYITCKAGLKEQFQQMAAKRGTNLNKMINEYLKAELEKENRG